jgi:hypothetical protein
MLDNLKLKLIQHKNKIKALAEIANAIAQYAITKSSFSLVGGGITALEMIFNINSNDPEILFSSVNNWVSLTPHKPVCNLFLSTLDSFPGKKLPFEYELAKLFNTPVGNFVVIYDRYNSTEMRILTEKSNKDQILSLLGDAKIKELNSKFIALDEISTDSNHSKLLLTPLTFKSIESQKSTKFITELQKSFDNNISRSLMLYGLPGTGKTTLSNTIMDHFGFRTLKLHPNDAIKLPYFLEIIDILKIEALILDDFDQIEMNDKLLEFLETVNTKLKLVIGIANILDGFDPAVLRPGRFDEIIKIEELEEQTLREILGDLTERFFTKVRDWPIAYVKELTKQSILNPELLDEKYEDLNKRIVDLKTSYENIETEIEENK